MGLLRTISVVAVCCLLGLPAAEARKPKPKKGGRMVILSATSGAEIFVDGERIGTVPSETPIPLSAGTHHIKVELRGYTAYEDDVRIRSGRETVIEADLIAHSGLVMVETPGVTASVVVDGKVLGPTPFDGEVTIGERLIEVVAPDHLSWRSRVTVKGGQIYPVSVELKPVEKSAVAAAVDDGELPDWVYNKWVWVGAGAAVLTATAIGIGVSMDDEPEAPKPHARVTVMEGGGYR